MYLLQRSAPVHWPHGVAGLSFQQQYPAHIQMLVNLISTLVDLLQPATCCRLACFARITVDIRLLAGCAWAVLPCI
jgi:hypothetical protein